MQVYDDDNGSGSGSAYLLDSIPIQATATSRNGSGLNAVILSRVIDPVLGSNFVADLDCTGRGPSLAVLCCYQGASDGSFLSGGELLIDLASPFVLEIAQVHAGGVIQFSIAVPNDPALSGMTASVQGFVDGAPGFEHSNALDVVLGL